MSVFSSLKKTLLGESSPASTPPATRPPEPEPDPETLVIPEIDATEIVALYKGGAQPVILDCREGWERRQVRIPGSLHIPMNETPARLAELPAGSDIYVVCALGSRSYGVSGYLLQHGFHAVNLRGGMAAWQAQGGEVESDYNIKRA